MTNHVRESDMHENKIMLGIMENNFALILFKIPIPIKVKKPPSVWC